MTQNILTREETKHLPEIGLIVLAAIVGYIGVKWLLGKLNPLSQGNIANTATNDLYQSLTGSQGTIGTDLYNLTHGNQSPASGPANPVYFLKNTYGNLVYDSTGTLVQTTIAPGQPGNPIDASINIDSLRGMPGYIFSD